MSVLATATELALGAVVAVGVGGLLWWAWWAGRDTGATGGTPPPLTLLGVAHPRSAEALCQLAAALQRSVRGRVLPMTVVEDAADEGTLARAEETVRWANVALVDEGLEPAAELRAAERVGDGLLHAALERDASLLVLGWPAVTAGGDDPVLDVLRRASCPVLVARLHGYRWARVVLRVPREPTTSGVRASLRLATETAEELAAIHDLPVTCVPADQPLPGDPAELVVTPVAPEEGALARELAASEPLADVVIAVCHGVQAVERRELTAASIRLYAASPVAS